MKLCRSLLMILIMVSIFSLSAVAQEPVYWDVVQKIRNEGFNNSQVMDHVSWMTDVFGPRLANSPSYLEAAEWAKKRFEELGLVNAEVEA
ncbi:peptidase M28, partial [candidate division KSB1 bacterium]|nr:peptidase M28 [candidate division KSB1 bacterium]